MNQDAPINDRFTLDPESGFVYDRSTEKWLTTAVEVFDAVFQFLPTSQQPVKPGE